MEIHSIVMVTCWMLFQYLIKLSRRQYEGHRPLQCGERAGNPLADPGGAPPNGRGPMIFYGQNANFSHFFLRSP